MSDTGTKRWTQVDHSLYLDHIRKLNTPKPALEPAYRDAGLRETLHDYRAVLALLNQKKSELRKPLGRRLRILVDLQMDSLTGLHHPKHLDTADIFHDGPVLAIKIKNLKKMRGRQEPPKRDFIYRMLARTVLLQSHQAFAGFYSRIYVLLESADQGHIIVRHLHSDLDELVAPLAIEGMPDEDIPYVLCGFGRTWQEAKLVSRGALRQEQVPLSL
jgi:hypothetical protein